MTYKQAMKQKCKCGKYLIGGWIGYPRKGNPNFAMVSSPVATEVGFMLEEHTFNSCYAPRKIA